MMRLLAHYHSLADLYEYPGKDYTEKTGKIIRLIADAYPQAAVELQRFLEIISPHDVKTLQELYTRSFDVQAITTLDTGYVLFGDDYKRGELLANLNREHVQAGNNCGTELADHLPNILRLIPKLKDGELAAELVQEIIAPALRKMINEFAPERIATKQKVYRKQYRTLIETCGEQDLALVYRLALNALYGILKQDFMIDENPEQEADSGDFLRSVARENEIEIKAGNTC